MNDNDIAAYMKNMPADMVAESAKYAPGAGGARTPVKSAGKISPLKNKMSVAAAVLLFIAGLAAAIILPLSLKNKRSDENEPVLITTDAPTAVPNVTPEPEHTATPPATLVPEATETPYLTDAPATTVPNLTDTPAATETAAQTAAPSVTETAAQTAAPTATETAAQTATPPVTPNVTATLRTTPTPNVTPTPNITATPNVTPTPNITPTALPTGQPVAGSLYKFSAVLRSGAMARAGLTGGSNYSEQNIDAKLAEFEAYIRQRIQAGSGNKYSAILAAIDRARTLGLINNSAVRSNEFVDANLIATDSFVLLSVDGRYYMPLDDMSLLVTGMVPVDYDRNGTSDLLLSAVASPKQELLLVFDRTAKQFTRVYSADVDFPSLMLGMLDGNAYAFNYRTDTGGKVAFNSEGNCYVGGMPAADFLAQVIADPEFDHYSIPELEYSTPAPATPPRTSGPVVTPGPSGATPVPDDDPLNMKHLSMRYSFLEVHQENKPWNYYHIVRTVYTFDGETMKPSGPCSFDLVTEWIAEYVELFKEQNESDLAISVSEPFDLEVIEGGEIVKVDFFDSDIDILAGDLDMNGFNALIDSNALVFNFDPDTGKTLPCFAVFLVKLTGHYIEVTGQYEYAEKYVMVPFVP